MGNTITLVAQVRDALAVHNYSAARRMVLTAAREGRAELMPAGARDHKTARVLIDGQDVGQASVLTHYVRELPSDSMFGLRKLVEEYPVGK
jgi:hypothetical protein